MQTLELVFDSSICIICGHLGWLEAVFCSYVRFPLGPFLRRLLRPVSVAVTRRF